MAKKKKAETADKTVTVTPKSLSKFSVRVSLDKTNKFGKDKLEVTVSLLEDGEVVSQDSDFISL